MAIATRISRLEVAKIRAALHQFTKSYHFETSFTRLYTAYILSAHPFRFYPSTPVSCCCEVICRWLLFDFLKPEASPMRRLPMRRRPIPNLCMIGSPAMPAQHRVREDWTPHRVHAWAARVGPNVVIFAEVAMRLLAQAACRHAITVVYKRMPHLL